MAPTAVAATCIPPSFITPQLGAGPTQNNLVVTGAYKIVVSWTAVAGTDVYEIFRGVDGSEHTILSLVNSPSTSFTDLDIEPSKTYSYTIIISIGDLCSCPSNTQSATTPDPVVNFFFGEDDDLSGHINTGWSQGDDSLWPFPRIISEPEPFIDVQTAGGYISSSVSDPAPGGPYNVSFQSRLSKGPASHLSVDPSVDTAGGWAIEKPIIRSMVAFPPGQAGGESRLALLNDKKLFSFLFSDGGETGVADAVIAFGMDLIDVESYEFGNRAVFRIYSGKVAPFSEVAQFELDYMDVLDGSDELRFIGVRANFAFKLATISVGSPADDPPPPVISNPGWEAWSGGSPDGWISGPNLSITQNTSTPIDGLSSLEIENTDNSLGIADTDGRHYQDLSLLRATKYNITVKIRKDDPAPRSIEIGSNNGAVYLTHTTASTSTITLDFDIIAFHTTIAFAPADINVAWTIDTLVVTEVPPTIFPGLGWGNIRTVEQA